MRARTCCSRRTWPRPTRVLNKGVGARELFETIRGVAAGEQLVGTPSAALLHEAHAHIADEDRA